jgi:selenocysteine lyase/cysteine desulfurase
VSFTVDGTSPDEIRRRLGQDGINVWTSPMKYTRLDMERRGLSSVVRASVHYYNSEDEVGRFCELVRKIVR